MKKAKRKARGPYKCTFCREFGHRIEKCPKRIKAQTILNALPGNQAIELIPPQIRLISVLEGAVHSGLQSAIEGNQRLAEQKKPHNDSLINAWTELTRRSARIPKKLIDRAKQAEAARRAANDAYELAIAPILAAINNE